ncbi:MAG: hypothetical protein GX606_03505 [Elusimicrobia bacterium]|nr:hypothetical protein [Elusimicrobiota bacterium]
MLGILDIEYVLLDVETTGLSPLDGDRIIEVAAVRLRRGEILDRFSSFVDPCRPLAAQNIHGITSEMIAGAPKADEVLPKVVAFIGGACVVAHNASFDIKFLCHELSLIGRRMSDQTPVLDTIKMSKAFLPYLSTHRLGSLAGSLGIPVRESHRALADTEVLTQVFQRMLLMASDHNIHTLPQLVDQFSVEKPSFRLNVSSQPSLF